MLTGLLGADRVIALDLSGDMLRQLHRKLPSVVTIRSSALDLPFADESLGAINCRNALQAMPDPHRVIGEAGRCLRPGGTLTLLTFRRSTDSVYRYFQRQLERQAERGSFDPDELAGWLRDAGMSVRELSGPGSFLFLTAVKN